MENWNRDRINLKLEGVRFVGVPAHNFAGVDFFHLSLYLATMFSPMHITASISTIFSFKLVIHNNVSPQGIKKASCGLSKLHISQICSSQYVTHPINMGMRIENSQNG